VAGAKDGTVAHQARAPFRVAYPLLRVEIEVVKIEIVSDFPPRLLSEVDLVLTL
jgi:hypothetical protein